MLDQWCSGYIKGAACKFSRAWLMVFDTSDEESWEQLVKNHEQGQLLTLFWMMIVLVYTSVRSKCW